MKITDYEIIRHGVEWPDYFQGCGVSFTKFDHVQTGIGSTEQEAFEDVMELIAQSHSLDDGWSEELDAEVSGMDTNDAREIVGAEEPNDTGDSPYWHVSIRYNIA